MPNIYFWMSNISCWKKLTFSKLRFSRKESLKKCTSFEEQKGTRYIRENVYFGIIVFNCLTRRCLRFLLMFLACEIKDVYQSFLRNEVEFTDIMNVSQNILAKKKTERQFCKWKSNDYSDINIFRSLQNPCIFLLSKKKDLKTHF